MGRSVQSLSLVKSHELQQSIRQLSNSQIESTTIMSRTEGKIEELSKITKETQVAFREFAGRIADRAQENRIQDQYVQNIQRTLQQLFVEHISGIVARPNSLTPGVHDRVEKLPMPSSRISELDQRLADLLNPSSTSTPREDDGKNTPEIEKASKYKTCLGEVYMRTIVMTCTSASEIANSAFPSWSSFISEPITFPITMTKTDILLLPRTWGLTRGATIRCLQFSGASTRVSDISIKIQNFRTLGGDGDLNQCETGYVDGEKSKRKSTHRDLKGKLSNTLQFLLYTAFRAAFLAIKVCGSRNDKKRQLSMKKPIPRSSFDEEINDIFELVHLWVSSGLEADFYTDAFPSDTTAVKQQCDSVFNAGNRKVGSIQRLRHEYILRLVLEMAAKCSGEDWLEGKDLHSIHQTHWERCQLLALSSTLDINKQPSHIYQASCDSSVFVATREGNILTLRRLLESKLESLFVRTISGISLLEIAIISILRILEKWWYDDILFKGSAKRREGDNEPLRELSQSLGHRGLIPMDRQQRLRNLFGTVEFLISFGLRLPMTPREFQHMWIFEVIREGVIVHSPNWDRWPWETKYGQTDTDCWTNYSFMASVYTFRYYLEKACTEEDVLDWERIEMPQDVKETAGFSPKEFLSQFPWLPFPDPRYCIVYAPSAKAWHYSG